MTEEVRGGNETSIAIALIVVATAVNGLLADGSLDAPLVKLPTRRRVGPLADAAFARGNDLGDSLSVK